MTAIQQAYGIIKFHLEASDPRFTAGLELIMAEFENKELLSKEREQIVEAYADGWVADSPDAEQYYSSKYDKNDKRK